MDSYNILTIDIDIEKDVDLEIDIESEIDIDIDFDESTGGGGELPYYTGDYEVIPKTYSQSLPTKLRSMSKDVTVLEIPYEEVHNISGTTVTIGGIL